MRNAFCAAVRLWDMPPSLFLQEAEEPTTGLLSCSGGEFDPPVVEALMQRRG